MFDAGRHCARIEHNLTSLRFRKHTLLLRQTILQDVPIEPCNACFTKILLSFLRNRLVAYIFATNQFHLTAKIMRRDVFQAIADPTRRAIIGLVALGALTPNAMADHFDISRQAVSKHLRILTECELLKPQHQGREIHYSLKVEKMKEVDLWLEQFRKIWEAKFNRLDKVLATMKKRKK